VFARWVPPESAFGGIIIALWAVLLACAGLVSAAIADKSKYGHLLGFLVFVLLIVLLFCAGLFIDCVFRPTGCDV
jgi:tryptophan-rich sensory protein